MSGRRLKAKPEAVAARGVRANVDAIADAVGASVLGDGDASQALAIEAADQSRREHATRVMNAGLAVERLKSAAYDARDAYANLVGLVGSAHPAARAALHARAEALKAVQLADNVLRVLMR